MNVRKYAKNLLIRMVKTMAETALAVIGSCALIDQVDWMLVLSSVAMSGIATVLLNLAHLEEN